MHASTAVRLKNGNYDEDPSIWHHLKAASSNCTTRGCLACEVQDTVPETLKHPCCKAL